MKSSWIFAAVLWVSSLPGQIAVAQALKPEVMEGARARILAMAVSDDGKLLATGGYDTVDDDAKQRAIRIWDLATRKQIRLFSYTGDSVNALAFSPDAISLAAGDEDGRIVCWQTATGKELFQTPKNDSPVEGLVFRRDRNVLISGSDKYYGWDAKTGKALGQQATHNEWGVKCMAISHNGTVVAAGCGLEGVLLNAQTLQTLRTFPGHSGGVEAVALSANHRRIAFGCNDGSITLWEVNRAMPLHTLSAHKDGVNCLAFIDEGRRLVSGGNDGKLRFWNFDKGVQEQVLDASTLAVDALVVTPDEKWLFNNDMSRIQARSLTGDRPTVRPRPSSPPSTTSTSPRDLNRLDQWDIVRGDWKQGESGIVGAGDSRINSRRTFPIDMTWRCKLRVHGETNPRIRFDAFHFGYEGRNKTFFLHGPKATGQPMPFEFDREYAVEVQIDQAGKRATLRVDGKEIAVSHPKPNEERTISIEAGGRQSKGSCEFYDIEIVLPASRR